MKFFLLFALLISPQLANAKDNGHFFFGVGPLFSIPGSVRIGFKSVEFGLVTPASLGVNAIVRKDMFYAVFGPHFGGQSGHYYAGLFGGVGIEKEMAWSFFLRGELQAGMFSNGWSIAGGLFGISFHF